MTAKFTAIQQGIRTFEDEFLADTVLPNNQTVRQYYTPQLRLAIESKQMPPGKRGGKEER